MRIVVRLCWFGLAVVAAGCATPPPRPAHVIAMGAGGPAPVSVIPVEGTIWRLDDGEFKTLGPLSVEPVSAAANAVPGGYPMPPTWYQDYGYGYVVPPPPVMYPFISYGVWFGFGYHSHGHRSHASHTRHSRTHSRTHSGAARTRRR